jgi:hypothetical protein
MRKTNLPGLYSSIFRAVIIMAFVFSTGVNLSAGPTQAAGNPSTIFLPVIIIGPPPSSEELIRNALDSGKIDYSTSLLYRAYALFGGDGLPIEYRGTVDEDNGLIEEWRSPSSPITPQVSALLAPFMVRPDLPESAWSLYAVAHPGVSTNQAQATIPCNPGSTWASISSVMPGVNVKVWASCDGNYDIHMKYLMSVILGLWAPETALMGQPIPDAGGPEAGGGPEIDFYLLNPLQAAPRPGNTSLPEDAFAATWSSAPFAGGKASAYILVPRDKLYVPRFNNALAHEIFHLLQSAHNDAITWSPDKAEWWFVEASAVWAGGYFVPNTSYEGAHFRFSNASEEDFQHSYMSLDSSGRTGTREWRNAYLAYIWPYFIQQEKGAATIGTIWHNLETVGTDWSAGLNVIDQVLPFKDNFHRFAVRNLNLALMPGNPIDPRYVNLDPNFPDDTLPSIMNSNPYLELTTLQDPPLVVTPWNNSLSTTYYHYLVPGGARQVILDLPGNPGIFNFDAVVLTRDGIWKLRELTGETNVTLCDAQELYLVASNHDTPPGIMTDTSFKIQAIDLPCTCSEFANVQSVTGTLSFSYQHTASDGTTTYGIDERSSVQFTLPQKSVGPGGVSFSGPVTGTAVVHDVITDANIPDQPTQYDGSGPIIPQLYGEDISIANLNIHFRDCTYQFGTTLYLTQTLTSSGSPTIQTLPVGSVRSGDFPLVINKPTTILAGNQPFDAHSIIWGMSNTTDAYIPADSGMVMFLTGAANDTNGGSAPVTWNITASTP